jgi:uncharacterized protein
MEPCNGTAPTAVDNHHRRRISRGVADPDFSNATGMNNHHGKNLLMKAKLLHDGPQRTFALVFDTGDEVNSQLLQFAKDPNLTGSHFAAIGAFSEVTLGFFDLAKQDYLENRLEEQLEVVSLLGNFAVQANGEHKLHAHVVVADGEAKAMGGHLLSARVRPTLEVVVTEEPTHLQRKIDQATGLPLIAIDDQPASESAESDSSSKHVGVGQGMYYSIDPPPDKSDWKQCPDCSVWVHGLKRESCPQCGHVFSEAASR